MVESISEQEKHRRYMCDYMRKKRAENANYGRRNREPRVPRVRIKRMDATAPVVTGSAGSTQNYNSYSENAKYHPKRDAPLQYANPYDQMFGDPPIGRRALDEKVGLV